MPMPDLGKQVGPLPLGAWVAVVGAGLGIAFYTRKENGSASPVVVDDVSSDPGVGQGAGGWQYVDPSTGGQAQTTAPIETNEQWGRAAVNYLIAQGYNASVADAAVRKYLVGQALNAQENALIIIALQSIGALPSALPPADSGPTDNGTTTPTNPTAYVGPARRKAWKKDNYARPMLTSWGAVLRYYYDNVAPAGSADANAQTLTLRMNNQGINARWNHGDLIPGSRVFLPNTV